MHGIRCFGFQNRRSPAETDRISKQPSSAILLFALVSVLFGAAKASPSESKQRPVVTSAVKIPRPIQDAMLNRQYLDAVKLIEREMQRDDIATLDYLMYLKGLALAKSDQRSDAVEAYNAFERAYPESEWIPRSRFGRAAVAVADRRYDIAGEIYRKEAERLLSRDRKDELANIYLEFADRFFEGEDSDNPAQVIKPDYKQALEFYQQALQLGPSPKTERKIEFQIARCFEELNQHTDAIDSYKRFVKKHQLLVAENDDDAMELLTRAHHRLGRSQLRNNQYSAARRTWQDFISKFPKAPGNSDSLDDRIAMVKFELSHTYGIPNPSTVGQMELGIGLANQFVEEYPDHPLAAKAELEIATAFQAHKRNEDSIAQLERLIGNERYRESTQLPIARRMLGDAYQTQNAFDKAIEAWKTFLDRHPTDSAWPAVQKKIISAEYAAAMNAFEEKRYDDARDRWVTFLNKYPLDLRAPLILFQFGEMKFLESKELFENRSETDQAGSDQVDKKCEKLFEAAISDWQRLVKKYPNHPHASVAALKIGTTLEQYLGRRTEAIDAYRRVSGNQQAAAQKRIKTLTQPELKLLTERKFRSDEQPSIRVTTRNLEQLTVSVYPIDMTDYFRKMHLASGVEELDIALIDPETEFEHRVSDFEEFKQIDQEIQIPLDGPGVAAVTVSGEKMEATTMVVVSDLDIVVKSSRNELFLFAQNMREGTPIEGVEILVSDGESVFSELTTDVDGIARTKTTELQTVSDLRVFAIDDGHTASTVTNLDGLDFAVGLAPRGLLFTDRPVYRPGELVNIKGIVRLVEGDKYVCPRDESMTLDVYDSRGRRIKSQKVTLNQFGTLHANLMLPESTPSGSCQLKLHRPGSPERLALSFDAQFAVRPFKIEPLELTVTTDKNVVFRGDKVSVTARLQYYYGTPIANEELIYTIGGNDENRTVRTDEDGTVKFEISTKQFSESQAVTVQVQCPTRNVTSTEVFYVATRGFEIEVSAPRNVYLNNETFDTAISVTDPSGAPISTDLKLEIFEQTDGTGQVRSGQYQSIPTGEKLVQSFSLRSEESDGKARQTLRIGSGGRFFIRATAQDQFGNTVSGQYPVFISDDGDSKRLRILAEKHQFKVGDEATVRLHWRDEASLALITYDGASVLGYKLVRLKSGENQLKVPITSELAPNFFLSVNVMRAGDLHQANSEFLVEKQLNIKLVPNVDELEPNGRLKVSVEATDIAGKPVRSELTLALVKAGMINQFGFGGQSVTSVFENQRRIQRIRVKSSCDFNYQPSTFSINEALLVESERRTRVLEEEAAVDDLFRNVLVDSNGLANSPDVELDGIAAMPSLPGEGNDSGEPFSAATQSQLPVLSNRQARFQGQQIWGDFAVGQVPATGLPNANNWSSLGRRRLSPRFAEQSYTVVVPYTEQVMRNGRLVPEVRYRQEIRKRSVPLASNPAQLQFNGSSSAVWSKQRMNSPLANQQRVSKIDATWLRDQTTVITGLTAEGRYLVLNGMNQTELDQLLSETEGTVWSGVSGVTGFWDPVIMTNEQGKAEIEIVMPGESTAWELLAAGITQSTDSGTSKTSIITRKSLFGILKAPSAFTVGDKAEIEAEIHQTIEGKRRLDVELFVLMDGREQRYRRTAEVDGPGVTTMSFPIEVIESKELKLRLNVSSDDGHNDTSETLIDVNPFGHPVYATTSGTSSQSTIALVSLNENQRSGEQSLEILIGGNVNESLVEGLSSATQLLPTYCLAGSQLQRDASDCIAGVALKNSLRIALPDGTPRAIRINEVVVNALSNLLSAQADDGSWSLDLQRSSSKDPMLSSRVMWALASARRSGFAVPQDQFEKGIAYLRKQFAGERDLDRQAVILLALTHGGAGDFALANRLFRERNRLNAFGLAHLMLILAEQKHDDMADQLVPLMERRAEMATRSRLGTPTEILALELLALQSMGNHPDLRAELAEKLMATRAGNRWPVESENGPAIASLSAHFGELPVSQEAVSMSVSVNGVALKELTLKPGDQTIRLSVPKESLVADQQKIEFDLSGRGRFSYSAVLTGYAKADEIKSTTNDWSVRRRYEPDQLRFKGKPINRGHGVVRGGYRWNPNTLTELPVGKKGRVTLSPRVRYERSKPMRTYLMLIERIPAGCTVLEESIQGAFDRYEIFDGSLVFYIGDGRTPGDIRYDLVGYTAGEFRMPPSILRSFYSPSEIAVSDANSLSVLPVDEKSKDEYHPTPDELFALGKAHFESDDFEAAHQHLSQLLEAWQLDPNPYRESVTMLFGASLQMDAHAETVNYFEVIKERFPEIELTFEEILRVASSYREISEYERSYLVYRATVEASFERENQVAGFLNKRGEFLRSVQTIESLLKDYPAESYVATASYALAQEVYRRSGTVDSDKRMVNQNVTRADLISGSLDMLEDFVTNWPEDPSADQACFAVATALIDLDQYDLAIERGNQYAERFQDSKLLDSFWYIIGFCYFELQDHQNALEMCRKVANAEFKDTASGISREAENKWEAIYIMGQVYHSLGKAAEAIDQYAKVSDRFEDAAEAIRFFSRQSIHVPNITNCNPSEDANVKLSHRNLNSVFVKVYRIDLMKFGLTRRNLNQITKINLAGITPYHEETLEFGDGKDYRDRETDLSLPLKERGAYLVVCRGENQYSSGLVLVTSLSLSVDEDATSGRIRVTVKNEDSGEFIHDVHVKTIGSSNDQFVAGQTDLRGLFVADDIRGTSTVIALSEEGEYAFHRGTFALQPSPLPQPNAPAEASQSSDGGELQVDFYIEPMNEAKQPLLNNIYNTNSAFQIEQQGNIEGLINNGRKGVQTKEAY